MSSFEIRCFRPDSEKRSDLDGIVALYNRALTEVHGFFPISKELFQHRILSSPWFDAELLLLAICDDQIIGMAHGAILEDPCYETGGVIELIAVAPEYRRQGIGNMLLDGLNTRFEKRRIWMVDALGTFPLTPFYTTLLDGSEKSGPELKNRAVISLFEKGGFKRRRESLIMRADLITEEAPKKALPSVPNDSKQFQLRIKPRQPEQTWLDHVFRGWKLWDSNFIDATDGIHYSRAIYGLMNGLSQHEGHAVYSIFGVNTPQAFRGKGYASRHLSALKQHLRKLGADMLELHVYSDNLPAMRLYEKIGFLETGRTVTMRKSIHLHG